MMIALEANPVLPVPDKDTSVIVPLEAVKNTLFGDMFELLTAARLNPVPLIIADPLESTLNVADPL
jgi:hypothetical protein